MADNQSLSSPPASVALWAERSLLVGVFLAAVAFGVHLTLFILCFRALIRGQRTRSNRFFLFYICLMFTLGNIGNGLNIKLSQMSFIDHRDWPGGPSAYVVQTTNILGLACNLTYIISSWLQDGLLVYRFYIFWHGIPYLLALPITMFATSTILSIFLMVRLTQPGITLWMKISIDIATPYWAISIALNVLITAFISARLLHMRHTLRKVLSVTGQEYLSITAMLVESAALYTTNGLIFLASYSCGSPVSNLALSTLGQTQSIAPLLIILRVAEGRGWSHETARDLRRTHPATEVELGMKFRLPESSSHPHTDSASGSIQFGAPNSSIKENVDSKNEVLNIA
ncbi:hypothetical protein CPB83DRAFT_884029 [Crepidotus variabilis]|uniref:Uncharacterized protein n=1 Tax=Crepidotus variabilis TaxID=179855 RepID=A0A9P6JP62_9AGAR|nr:hypothetical protein CPB83DRAFT_884029 [Crepidotus variabilis]